MILAGGEEINMTLLIIISGCCFKLENFRKKQNGGLVDKKWEEEKSGLVDKGIGLEVWSIHIQSQM